MDLSLRQLRAFLTVAGTGHVTRAAGRLNLSQPAVTHQLRQLEAALGMTLVERSGRRIALTPQGEALAAELAPALGGLEVALDRARARPRERRGLVRVAALHSYNEALVIPAAAALSRTETALRLATREMAADAIEVALMEGRADVGLTFQVRRTAALRVEPVCEERLFAAFSGEALPEAAESLEIADLAGRPLALLPRDYALRALIDDLAASARIKLEVAFETTSVSGLLSYARKSLAIAIVPELAVDLAAGLRTAPLARSATRTAYLVRPRDQASSAVDAFGEAVQEVAASLGRRGA